MNAVKWSSQNRIVATGGADRKVKLWDVSKGMPSSVLIKSFSVRGASFLPFLKQCWRAGLRSVHSLTENKRPLDISRFLNKTCPLVSVTNLTYTNITSKVIQYPILESAENRAAKKHLNRFKIRNNFSLKPICSESRKKNFQTAEIPFELHCATKFGSCLVLGVLTVGLYSLVIKTTETAFFSAVKIRLGSGEFFF